MNKEFIDPTDVDGGESTSENKSDKKQNEANESSDSGIWVWQIKKIK